MSDVGFTHVALLVGDLDASIGFYARYADMQVVHQRAEHGSRVAWVSDRTRPFVIVLIQVPSYVPRAFVRFANRLVRLVVPFEHMGVGCASRDEVDRRCARAREEGCLSRGPADYGPPVGYWAFLTDPDGHTLELSYGQEVGLTVARTRPA